MVIIILKTVEGRVVRGQMMIQVNRESFVFG